MEIKYSIPDEEIRDFTYPAKAKLTQCSKQYTKEIIQLSKTSESAIRQSNAQIEITDTHVSIAVGKYKTEPKRNIWHLIVQILSELFLFVAGLMFSIERIVPNGSFDLNYFVILMLVMIVAIICTVVAHLTNN